MYFKKFTNGQKLKHFFKAKLKKNWLKEFNERDWRCGWEGLWVLQVSLHEKWLSHPLLVYLGCDWVLKAEVMQVYLKENKVIIKKWEIKLSSFKNLFNISWKIVSLSLKSSSKLLFLVISSLFLLKTQLSSISISNLPLKWNITVKIKTRASDSLCVFIFKTIMITI